MNTHMPLLGKLTGYEEEWLVRASTKWRPGVVMPPSVVAQLAEAGLGEPNAHGTLDINDAGRQYLARRDLPCVPRGRRRT